MKILGRILIILFAFVFLSGLMVTAVNAAGINQPNFGGDNGRVEFRPQSDEEGGLPFRLEGERSERGEHGDRGGGSRWAFGLIKNIGVITILVLAIAWPRSVVKKKKRTTIAL